MYISGFFFCLFYSFLTFFQAMKITLVKCGTQHNYSEPDTTAGTYVGGGEYPDYCRNKPKPSGRSDTSYKTVIKECTLFSTNSCTSTLVRVTRGSRYATSSYHSPPSPLKTLDPPLYRFYWWLSATSVFAN